MFNCDTIWTQDGMTFAVVKTKPSDVTTTGVMFDELFALTFDLLMLLYRKYMRKWNSNESYRYKSIYS